MCKFVQVIYKPSLNLFLNLHYIPDIQRCYSQYSKYLQDDFAKFNVVSYRNPEVFNKVETLKLSGNTRALIL